MFDSSKDKNSLAMLAIPVLLAMTLGLSGDLYRDASSFDSDREGSRMEESDEVEMRSGSEQQEVGTQESFTQKGDSRKRRNEMRKAIESNDYEGFLVAVAGTSFAEIMNKDAFGVLVHEHHIQNKFRPSPYYDVG